MSATPPTHEAPLISLRNVAVSYWLKSSIFRRRAYWALKDVSFDLYRGESLGIIGRNGCGKSTLLRLLADVMSPDKGTIVGADKVRSTLLSLNLGFVDYLSGRENALLSGMFLGMSRGEIAARMPAIIEFSELGDFIDQPLNTYSSGMRARLGFAVAFQVQPDILLVDEVTGVGDASFHAKSTALMKERLHSEDNTIIFVSHSPGQIREMCTRVVWIEAGCVEMEGDTDTVLSTYIETMTRKREVTQASRLITSLPSDRRVLFAREEGDKVIYLVQNGSKRRLTGADEFHALGGSFEDVYVLPADIFRALPDQRR